MYSCVYKCTHPLQNIEHFNNFNKIRGIMNVSKLFHIANVYIYIQQDKIITEFSVSHRIL